MRLILALIVVVLISAAATIQWLRGAENTVVTSETIEITVPNGATMRQFAADMVDKGLLEEPWSFRIWTRYLGLSTALRAGEYRLEAGSTMRDLMEKVTSGKVIDYPVTFIEGWNFKQVLQALTEKEKLKQTLAGLDDAEIMSAIGAAGVHPEGRFYPDTYHYTATMSDRDILRQAYNRMKDFVAREWDAREDDLPIKSIDETLILASIIEKETGAEHERRDQKCPEEKQHGDGVEDAGDPTKTVC